MRLLVFAPELLALNAEDLHPDAAWRGRVVGNNLRRQRRVAHDHVVGSWLCKHALREVGGEIIVDNEFAHHALRNVRFPWSVGRGIGWTYALCLQMCAAKTVHVFVEVHHLEAVELIRDFLDLLLLPGLNGLDTLSVPFDICAGCFLVLSASLHSAAGDFAIVNALNSVVTEWASFYLCAVHVEIW